MTDIEDRVVHPENLQKEIDRVLGEFGGLKAFVRASGTEDVLRLHVEAKDVGVIENVEKAIARIIEQDKELN